VNFESLYESLQWDNPEDQYSTFWTSDKCTLAEIAEGFEDLLPYLNKSTTKVEDMDDVVALSKQYDKTWWRFIDPALSSESAIEGSNSKITIAMYECSEHIILIAKLNNRWQLVEDKSDYEDILNTIDEYRPSTRDPLLEDFSDDIDPEHREELDAAGAELSQRRIEELGKRTDWDQANTTAEKLDEVDSTQGLIEEISELKDLIRSLKERIQETEQELQETNDVLRAERKVSSKLEQQLGQISRFLKNPG
jgi:hypothetical protein